MALPTASSVIARYLYNSEDRPTTLISDDLIRDATAEGQDLLIDMSEHMTVGAGRFANASQIPLIVNFFYSNASALDADGLRHEYSIAQMQSIVGGHHSQIMQQYHYFDATDDVAARTLIYNTSEYEINSWVNGGAKFIVEPDGRRYIENVALLANDEDFDFDSSDFGAWIGNPWP